MNPCVSSVFMDYMLVASGAFIGGIVLASLIVLVAHTVEQFCVAILGWRND